MNTKFPNGQMAKLPNEGGAGDGLVIGRSCGWVVVRGVEAGMPVEHVRLCVLVGSEHLELRRLVRGAGEVEADGASVEVPWKLTPVEVWGRRSFVRLATVDDMRPVELKFAGVMKLFGIA